MKNMKYFVLPLLLACVAFPVMAQEPVTEEQDEKLLMIKSVILSSQADAHNEHCEKETDMAGNFIRTFQKKRGLTEDEAKQYHALSDKVHKQAMEHIKDVNKPCSDLDMMMMQLEVMKDLRNVSYLLNGIDPKSVPMNADLPNLEDLLPAPSPDSLPIP